MKKYLFINAIALAMIGCGGGGGDSKPTPTSQPASSTPASSVPASSIAASSTPASSSAAASSVSAAAWTLVWSDDFEGTSLDTTKWSYEKNCVGGGNNELQCYTSRTDNSFVSDGKLHIVAKKETFAGQAKGDDDSAYSESDTSQSRDYTSARLRSKNKGDWKYGRMEVRAKLPQGQGMWPAIWMLPTDWEYGGWPLSGEIDIMEAVNTNTGSFGNKVNGTLHYGKTWPNNSYTGTSYSPAKNVWEEFHTYSVEWQEDVIRWYVDDALYLTLTDSDWYTAATTAKYAPFDKRFHMILNLAVGGNWPGAPVNATVFPQEMTVDFVHVYSCSADSVKGKGCSTAPAPVIVTNPAITGTFNLFVEAVDPLWNSGLLTWDNNSGVIKATIIDSGDVAHGKVINVKYGSTNGLAYIQSSTNKDASVFATGGNLQFDLKVINYGSATGINVKADCVYPCTSGDLALPGGKVADGKWETINFPIASLVAGGLKLGKLNTPIGISPIGSQDGVELQIDNVRWVK